MSEECSGRGVTEIGKVCMSGYWVSLQIKIHFAIKGEAKEFYEYLQTEQSTGREVIK